MKSAHKNELLALLNAQTNVKELDILLQGLLTRSEYEDIVLRVQLLKELQNGTPQRDIAKKLDVSISKVTRGSRALQDSSKLAKSIKMFYK